MHALSAIERLPSSSRTIVTTLLKHRTLCRLAKIRQIGFSLSHQQTRLHHTLESIELAANFLEGAGNLSATVRNHLLAAVVLEDVGRAPFSNSLDPIFTAIPGASAGEAIDKRRSIVVVEHLERTEGLLSKHSLSCETIVKLLKGTIPWKKGQWARSLVSGPIDVDRIQYVKGDIEYSEGLQYDVGDVARSLVFDEGSNETLINASYVPVVIDFLLERIRLYIEVYYEPVKLAMEHVVRLFFRQLWDFIDKSVEGWYDVREPRLVEEFLHWTDETVLAAFEGERWKAAPEELSRLRTVIRNGELQVAELQERGASVVHVDQIEGLLVDARNVLTQREHCWILEGDQLPPLQVYYPGSVSVLSKGKYRDLASTPELVANPKIIKRMRRTPLIVFPAADFAVVQNTIHDAGLVLRIVTPLSALV
jgi:HD superfamily phosphohydrolase